MATRDTYEVQTWEDAPIETSPLSAARFNHMEQGIKDASDNRALKSVYDDTSINLGRKEDTDAGAFSVTEGEDNEASGIHSHAGGNETVASGVNSFTAGYKTIASGANQFVIGFYNEIPSNMHIFVIGNGDTEESRKNALTVDRLGNAVFEGNVQGTYNGRTISLYGLQTEMESRYNSLQQQIGMLSSRIAELEASQNNGEEGGETT